MGGVWEPKSIDFRTLFDVFSMQNFDCNLERQKIVKKGPKNNPDLNFRVGAAVCAGLGGRIIGWGEGKFWPQFKAWPSNRPLRLGFLD